MSFQIRPGQLIKIAGCELTGSTVVADKLGKFCLDSIEGRLSFFEDGRYPHGAEKYTCGVAVAVTQEGRIKQHFFCKSRFSEVGHLASMVR